MSFGGAAIFVPSIFLPAFKEPPVMPSEQALTACIYFRLAMIPPKASYERLVAGGLAGAISRTCVAPFERLRTILMTDSSVNLVEAAKNVYRSDGILGLP